MLLVVLIPYLFLEIYISLDMLEKIGAFWATIWTIATIMIGSGLLKNSPYAIMGNMYSLQMGKLDFKKFQNTTTFYFFGAILLIIPGVFSDFLGIIALLYIVYLQFIATITPEKSNIYQNQKGDDDVIDVEIVNEYTNSHDCIKRK
ncbi:MAG: FxsA family protein [Sulfurovum sp.]|nr:FxsA family protein [Sulfurovum sp.]